MMKELFPVGGSSHGGGFVAALQLYLNPDACRMDLATSGKMHDFHGLKVTGLNSVDFKGFPINIYFNYDEISDPTGVVGDGNEATAEKGKALYDRMVEGASAFVEWSKGISWKV